jgi:hypothetical protein
MGSIKKEEQLFGMNKGQRQLLLGINKIAKTYSSSNATQGSLLQPISHKKS